MRLAKVTLYVRVWIETNGFCYVLPCLKVTLYVRVWIETVSPARLINATKVTLYVRVWIETTHTRIYKVSRKSPST